MNYNMFYSKLKTVLALAALVTILYSCSSNSEPSGEGNLSIGAKSTAHNGVAKSVVNKSAVSTIEITKLLLNLKEFELEVDIDDETEDLMQNDKDWDDDGKLDFEDELKLKGPFEVDLLSGQLSFLDITVPFGKYEELEFKFGPSPNPDSELFGKSILVEGTVNEVPFIYSHKFTEKVEVDFEDPNFDIVVSEVDNGIVIDFDVNQLFDAVNGVDLSQAVDGNNDGVIEIDHSDVDGNKTLADAIRKKIIAALDLLDD